jgi:hypothetical protein
MTFVTKGSQYRTVDTGTFFGILLKLNLTSGLTIRVINEVKPEEGYYG